MRKIGSRQQTDPLSRAIAAADEPKVEVFTMTLSSGRTVDIRIPLDCTVIDILEMTSRVAGQLPVAMAQRKKQPASRIIVPS